MRSLLRRLIGSRILGGLNEAGTVGHRIYWRSAAPATLVLILAVTGLTVPSASAAGVVSQATAQSVFLSAVDGAVSVALSNPPTTATSNGSGPNDLEQSQPSVAGLSGVSWLGVGALSEAAEADADGTSSACAGIVQPGGRVQIGTGRLACSSTNTGSGGVTIDLSQFAGLGAAISSIADVKLRFDAITAYATEDDSGAASGSAQLLNGTVTAAFAGGLEDVTLPLTIASAPDQSLLGSVDAALEGANDPLLASLTSALANVAPTVADIETNYQTTTPAGAFEVSALHISLLDGTAGFGNLAEVTVGPNFAPPATASGSVGSSSSIGSGLTNSSTNPALGGAAGSTATNSIAATATQTSSSGACSSGSVVTGYSDSKPITWTLKDPNLTPGSAVIGRVMEGNRVVLSRPQTIGTGHSIEITDSKPTDAVLTGEIVIHHAVAVRLAVRPMAVAVCASAASAPLHNVTFMFHLPSVAIGTRIGGSVFSSGVKVQSFNLQVRPGHLGTFVDHSPLVGTLLANLYRPGSGGTIVIATTLSASK